VLPTLGKVDAVVTDPPFGEKTHKGQRSLEYRASGGGHVAIDFDSVDASFVRDAFAINVPRRWLVSFIEWRHCLPLESDPPLGLEFVRMGVWIKKNPMPQLTGDRPGMGWEAIAIFHPPGKKRWNGGGSSAVWDFGTSRYGWFGASNHPTEKPVDLLSDLIKSFSDCKEIVGDWFMGSGSVGIACVRTGRKFIGIEKEPKYFDIACKRIQAEYDRVALFAGLEEDRQGELFSGGASCN
jgi:site-specific DNA-methyltransferase (adenine-specific)